MKIIIKNELMGTEEFKKYVEKKVKGSKKIQDQLKKLSDNYYLKVRIKKIADEIYKIFLNIPKGKFNYNLKKGNETQDDYLKKLFRMNHLVMVASSGELPQKDLRSMKHNTSKVIIERIKKFIATQSEKLLKLKKGSLADKAKEKIVEDL